MTFRQYLITTIAAAGSFMNLLPPCPADYQYQFDPSDFATEYIDYLPGAGHDPDYVTFEPFTEPSAAIGRPTVDTTGTGWSMPIDTAVPVVSVYPAFRSFELVTVGHYLPAGQGSPEIPQGRLVLKFDHPVINHPDNPYGIDFNIFGNASVTIDSVSSWDNGDPNTVTGSSQYNAEPATVSVSQYESGPWYTFPAGPCADDFAPTLGREYDTSEPYRPDDPADTSWDWNLWWGQPTFPTIPVEPALSFADLAGLTVAEHAQLYRHLPTGTTSAGGAGFDLDWLDIPGLDWIQYVRIDGPDYGSAEIDAVADVMALIDGDVNLDRSVNAPDLTKVLSCYGRSDNPGRYYGDLDNNGQVNAVDLISVLVNYDRSDSLESMATTTIPEPASAVICLFMIAPLMRRTMKYKYGT